MDGGMLCLNGPGGDHSWLAVAYEASGHLLPPWPRVGHRNRFEGAGEGLPLPSGAPSTIEITSVDAPRGAGGGPSKSLSP